MNVKYLEERIIWGITDEERKVVGTESAYKERDEVEERYCGTALIKNPQRIHSP